MGSISGIDLWSAWCKLSIISSALLLCNTIPRQTMCTEEQYSIKTCARVLMIVGDISQHWHLRSRKWLVFNRKLSFIWLFLCGTSFFSLFDVWLKPRMASTEQKPQELQKFGLLGCWLPPRGVFLGRPPLFLTPRLHSRNISSDPKTQKKGVITLLGNWILGRCFGSAATCNQFKSQEDQVWWLLYWLEVCPILFVAVQISCRKLRCNWSSRFRALSIASSVLQFRLFKMSKEGLPFHLHLLHSSRRRRPCNSIMEKNLNLVI